MRGNVLYFDIGLFVPGLDRPLKVGGRVFLSVRELAADGPRDKVENRNPTDAWCAESNSRILQHSHKYLPTFERALRSRSVFVLPEEGQI